MIHTDKELGSEWYESLEEAKQDGHVLIPCTHVLYFFKLEERKTILEKENLIPIPGLRYLLKSQDKYFIKSYPGYSVDELFFYYRDKNAEVNESIETLMTQVSAGLVTLIYDKSMIDDTKAMLLRVYKANHKEGEGTMEYKDFIPLLDETLKLNDYREYGSGLIGYKTVCSQFVIRITDMWHKIRLKNN